MMIEWKHVEGCRAKSNPDALCRCPADPWEEIARLQVENERLRQQARDTMTEGSSDDD